ncbi:hypothetical protein EZV62_015621 [Acer yangbiense]|uniref:Major facilitator superfamily (MFS) profile domain-containing protein n=1 Tax=Acer yangbiense TaxID=1000413 RepID=A0A5C7HNA5_9ROSI|nr:hypothetical protein EZV62_015621 [Acer yangbiense]
MAGPASEHENNREALLKKNYENCPGCKIELLNDTNPSIPFKLFFSVWIVVLASALPISSLFPFLYFMIRDFNIAKREEDIGFYAGFVGSAFMFGRALTSVLWGVIADRYGRKPVIMFGIGAVVIFNTLFGLSTNFWMAISTRFLLGSLCGILGPMRAYASEVCRKEYQALAMSIISTSWGIGLVIGPALGGFLAQETIHIHDGFEEHDESYDVLEATNDSYEVLEGTLDESNMKEKEQIIETRCPSSQQSLLKNWPLMTSILVYCVFQLHDMAYSEIFSLWAVSPRKNGGLSYSTTDVGEVLAVSGLKHTIAFLLSLNSYAEGPQPHTIGQLCIYAEECTLFSLNQYTFVFKQELAVYRFMHRLVSITTGLFLLQNRAVTQQQRGAANGISMSAMSLFKAVGPAAGGSIFSWAQKRQNASFLPGDQMVFFMLNIIEVIGLLMTFKPFLALPDQA